MHNFRKSINTGLIREPFDRHLPDQNGIWMKFVAFKFYLLYVDNMPHDFF